MGKRIRSESESTMPEKISKRIRTESESESSSLSAMKGNCSKRHRSESESSQYSTDQEMGWSASKMGENDYEDYEDMGCNIDQDDHNRDYYDDTWVDDNPPLEDSALLDLGFSDSASPSPINTPEDEDLCGISEYFEDDEMGPAF